MLGSEERTIIPVLKSPEVAKSDKFSTAVWVGAAMCNSDAVDSVRPEKGRLASLGPFVADGEVGFSDLAHTLDLERQHGEDDLGCLDISLSEIEFKSCGDTLDQLDASEVAQELDALEDKLKASEDDSVKAIYNAHWLTLFPVSKGDDGSLQRYHAIPDHETQRWTPSVEHKQSACKSRRMRTRRHAYNRVPVLRGLPKSSQLFEMHRDAERRLNHNHAPLHNWPGLELS